MQTGTSYYQQELAKPFHRPTITLAVLEASNYNLPELSSVTASVSASLDDDYLGSDQLIDGVCAEPGRYLVLDTNACLDQYQLFGEDQPCPAGWWTQGKSNASGNFTTPYPYAEVVYDPPVQANAVRVSVTQVYSGAKQVAVYAWYQGAGSYTSLGTLTFGASEYQKKKPLGEVKPIAKLKVEILSTKAVTDYGRLMELEPLLEWTPETVDLTPYVREVSVRKSSGDAVEAAYPAPGVGVNQLNITFDASVKDVMTLRENQVILLSQGFGGQDHLAQGVFLADPPKETVDEMEVTAYSVLQLARHIELPDRLWQGATTSRIIRELLSYAGVPVDKVVVALSADQTWAWFYLERQKLDNALMEACRDLGVTVYEDEQGYVYIRSSYGSSVMTITDDIIEDCSHVRQRLVNCVVVHYSLARLGEMTDVWSLGDDLTVPVGGSTYVFTLSRTPAVQLGTPKLIDPPSGVGLGTWTSDGFSLNITLNNTSGSSQTIKGGNIKIQGRPVELSQERVYQARDEASIRNLRARTLEITTLCGSDAEAKRIGDSVLAFCQKAADVLSLTLVKPLAHLQLRDVVTVNSATLGISGDYVVQTIELDMDKTVLDLVPKEAFV